MRILFLTQWFDPEPGALRGLPLARFLQARGHQVGVLTGFPNYPGGRIYPGYLQRWRHRETMDGVPVLRVPLYPSHDRSAVRRVANYLSFAATAALLGPPLAGRGADLVYVYHPPATIAVPGLVFKAVRRLPVVYHIADMWPESVIESGMVGRGVQRRVLEATLSRWCRFVYRQSAAITVLSPGFKRLLVERGVPPDKVDVVYNWTDDDVFRPVPRDETLAAALGLQGRFNVVYAGNLGPLQQLDVVVRAAALLQHDRSIQIVIAGRGQDEGALKALARDLGADNVLFLDARPFKEMPSINALADVLLVHLRDLPFFAATIPSKTQVALASARPVLMAVAGDAADVVRSAGAGLACPPGDPAAMAASIRALRALPDDEREAMGRRGREYYLQQMSLTVGGQRMEEIFTRVARRAAST